MIAQHTASLILAACPLSGSGEKVFATDTAIIDPVTLESPDGKVQCTLAVDAGPVDLARQPSG